MDENKASIENENYYNKQIKSKTSIKQGTWSCILGRSCPLEAIYLLQRS